MCSIHSNNVADEGFREMGSRDKAAFELRLAKMAEEDSIEACNGLGKLIKTVDDCSWFAHFLNCTDDSDFPVDLTGARKAILGLS